MALINRSTLTPQQMAQIENAIAGTAKNAADIDYVAMMADVDMPESETEVSMEE